MTESMKRRAISLGVITIMLLGLIIPAGAQTVQAADGSKKITISDDHKIVYGEGTRSYTLLKKTSFDNGIGGNKPVLCMQPTEISPASSRISASFVISLAEYESSLSTINI